MIRFSNVSELFLSAQYGSDNNMGLKKQEDGFGNGPVKTFERVFALISDLRKGGMQQPITVRILDDTVCLNETVHIDGRVHDLTIKPADEKKRVVITGSKRITGFYETKWNGCRCFAAKLPEVKEEKWSFTDLYVDGQRAELPRYPEKGYLIPKEVEVKSTKWDDGSQWFIAQEHDLDNIENITECYLGFTHFWVDEHTPIVQYEPESKKVVMQLRSRYRVYHESEKDSSVMEYYLEGVREGFGKPNQWFLDRKEGILYYIPRNAAQNIFNIQVYAPVTAVLFDICGDENRHVKRFGFSNIDFCYTDGDYYRGKIADSDDEKEKLQPKASDEQAAHLAPGAIRFEKADGCFIENCSFRNFGYYGVSVEEGCHNIRIWKNKFYDGGAGGIKINGADGQGSLSEETYGINIADNEIAFCGRKYLAACGILLKHTYENIVTHNTIHDLSYTGISVGWVWGYQTSVSRDNIIEKNHIYNLGGTGLSDLGGIYLLGEQPGTIVRNNIIHDIKARHYGGHGIYTDEGSSYITIENNLCYRFSSNAFNQHYGKMNIVRNNIFAFGEDGVLKVCRPEMHLSVIFERNIVVGNHVPMYTLGFWNHFSTGIAASKNLFFDYGRTDTYLLEADTYQKSLSAFQWEQGIEENSLIGDPLFYDIWADDYRLADKSPAFEIDFCPFDISDVGVRK